MARCDWNQRAALVTFNYETEEEAAAAREQMRQQVARAKTIREVRDRLNRER
jgi:hypothetical protein